MIYYYEMVGCILIEIKINIGVDNYRSDKNDKLLEWMFFQSSPTILIS